MRGESRGLIPQGCLSNKADKQCSIRGHPSFGEHATIGFYATPPFLRSENDEVSKAMKSECSLVENSLYITYNIHKGVIKVDQVSDAI